MEVLLGLTVFGVLIVFLAAVGHGIWLVMAAVWKAVFDSPEPPPRDRPRRRSECPGCRTQLLPHDRTCPVCRLDLDSRLADNVARLRTSQRDVRALADRGELDTETADRVTALLGERARSLLDGTAARPVAVPARTREETAPPAPLPVQPEVATAEEPPPLAAVPPPEPSKPPEVAVPTAPPEPPEHRRGVLAAFMEERNILWGELVGGLLIVGCSVALVLTLWKQLEELPYFPFLLATAITAALFGAGQYTLHHWKLEATSRGLLVIALLLAPLNLLLLANPGTDTAAGWLDPAVKLAAVALFVGMVRAAGRDLIGTDLLPGPIDRRWLLALAVVGAPASQLLPVAGSGGSPWFLAGWLPLACHALACSAVLGGLTWYRPRDEERTLSRPRGAALLTFAGMSLFALVAAWGLVLTRSPDVPATVIALALPLVVAGMPVAQAGVLVQQRADDAGVRATGTGVALGGSLLLAVGIGLAWPDPLRLLVAAALVGAVFTRVAWREALPWFHAGAVPALGFAAVLAIHGLLSQWAVPEGSSPGGWLRSRLTDSTSGMTLAGFGLLLAAVAELIAWGGNRAQAAAYAFGGLAAGVAGLFLVNVHGADEPWPAVAVHAGCALGLLAANVRWRRRVFAEAGVWLVLVGTLWALRAVGPRDEAAWGLTAAAEALALAALALGLTPYAARPGRTGVLFGQYRVACRNVATAAGVVAVALALGAPAFPSGHLHTITFLTLAAAGPLLARVFARPWPTWAGSVFALVGLAHLTVHTAELRPVAAALLLALLGHATLSLLGAFALRGRRARNRLFADPLHRSAVVVSVLTVPFVLVPSATFAPAWAGFAVWLAAVWFALAWVWRVPVTFAAANGALAAAAVFAGLTWAERQEWWQVTSLGAADPRALQAYGVSLAVLMLGWVTARRVAAGSERVRALWLTDPLAADRVIGGAVVLGQLLVLAASVMPAVRAELATPGWAVPAPPPEAAHAFGPGVWLLLGLLAAGLLAALRLAPDDDTNGDALVLGLAVLGMSAAVAAAGAFGPELAAATALRWALAGAFLAGCAVLWSREPLAVFAAGAGFRARVTSVSTVAGYAIFTAGAIVVIFITLNLTQIGLSGQQPAGPVEGSVFARLGYTASFLVPLGLLVTGLAGSAARERAAGFAFAGGLVFVGMLASGYALSVVTAGESIDAIRQVRLVMLASGGAAVWALAWLAASRRVPGGPLLAVQSALGFAGIGLLAVGPPALLFFSPSEPLPPAFAEFGRFGWLVLALAGWAGSETAARQAPGWRWHVVGFAAVAAGVLAACAVQPWDEPGLSVSFGAMAAVWAAAGLGLTAAVAAAPVVPRGQWVTALAGVVTLAALVAPTPAAGKWVVPLALAGYALASAGIAVSLRRAAEPDRWVRLFPAHIILALVVVPLAVGVTVGEGSLPHRLAGSPAVLFLAVAAGLLARVAPAHPAGILRFVAVIVAAGGVALVGWAVPAPDAPALWLQRNGWAFVALVVSALACLEAVPRLPPGSAWPAIGRRVGAGLGAVALATLVVVLVQQIPVYDRLSRRTPLPVPAVLSILAGVVALLVLALRFALRPAADPLGLPDRRRLRYVYLAELLLVAVFVHVRLNIPELFLGHVARYWTFIVMLLAFVGIGLAELFEQRGMRVLAVPLRRTGVLLPLLPLLAFWSKPPAGVSDFVGGRAPGARPFLDYLEHLPRHFDNYAGLWFLAGLLYGLVALSRRSFGWALLGALAANAGVWAMLAHTGVSAAVHPQVWAIPLALIVLVSEHVNRRDLRPDVAAGLRYLGIGMLYVSSSADMFIAGIGESLWLPVVLAVFCVAGIFGGIVLRVRAFLFLGVGFLLLDIFAMIWHAAVDRAHTWVWYASGIVLGAAILALFAVFEKRRNDVLAVVERVRRWD